MHIGARRVCVKTALFLSQFVDRAGSSALPCGDPKEESKHFLFLSCFDPPC